MHMPTNVCNNFNVSWPNEIILHILLPIRIICVRLHNFILPINGILLASFCTEKNWKNSSQFLHDETLPRLMIAFFFCFAHKVLFHNIFYLVLCFCFVLLLSLEREKDIWYFSVFFIAFIFIFIFAKDYCVGSLYYWIIARHFSLSLSHSLSSCWFVCLHKNTIINTSWELEKRILYHMYALYAGPMKACRKNK